MPAHLRLFVHLLLPLLCGGGAMLSGQGAFAPAGAEWCSQFYDAEGRALGHVLVRYDRDTVVGGRPLKVLTLEVKEFTPRGLRDVPQPLVNMVRQSGDSVFYYIPNIGVEVYLFKESYETGEETHTYLYNDPFDVLSVEREVIDGVELPVAELNLVPRVERDMPTVMYGRWGPDRGFVSPWGFAEEGWGRSYLEAVRADSVPEIKIVPRSQCFALMDQPELIVTTPAAAESCAVRAFPNPVPRSANWIRLAFNCPIAQDGPFVLEIFDMSGRRTGPDQLYSEMPGAVRVSGLIPGMYYGVFHGKKGHYPFTFLKN